jgi:aldehyde:ferredoxin oxidoreductase
LIRREDTDGIDLTWGNAEAIVALTEKIAKREGFGAVLADGPDKAAERIGKGSEKYVMAVRGKGIAFHDPRMSPAGGTACIADANPGHHMNSQITSMLEEGAPVGSDHALQVAKLDAFSDFGKKGKMYATGAAYQQLLDIAGMCALYATKMTPPNLADLISGVTGWDLGWDEALRTGRRVLTLRQAFNAREGITPDQIDLPKRIKEEPLPLKAGAPPKIDFHTLRKGFFEAMGWDTTTGAPSKETLSELGLSELVKDL